jgi:outer membrane protein
LKRLNFLLAAGLLSASVSAQSVETRIGFVSTERLFREAAPAVRALKKLEKEFAPRDQELQKLA